MPTALTTAKVVSVIDQRQVKQWQEWARNHHPADLAEILESLESTQMIKALRWLPTDIASQVFTFLPLDKKNQIIRTLSNYELKFLDELYGDEIIDVIDEMPANITKKVLLAVTPAMRSKVNSILNYPEETAGAIMSVDFLALRANLTVREAQQVIKTWIAQHDHHEEMPSFFVISDKRHLLGSVQWNAIMLNKQEDQLVKKIIKPYSISVNTLDDQETVAQKMQKYDLNLVPVVNFQNCLVGVIDAKEVSNIIRLEATEDIGRLIGSSNFNEDYFQVKIKRVVRASSVWLVSIMLAATLSQIVIQACLRWYHVSASPPATNRTQWIITALLFPLLPLIAGTCGNAGAQSSSRVVRGIALGHIGKHQRLKAVGREFKIALITGLILITINAVRMIIMYLVAGNQALTLRHGLPWKVILVATISLYWTELISKSLGASLPFVLQSLRIDPALASVPLVTTLIDALSTTIFFGMGAVLILPHLVG